MSWPLVVPDLGTDESHGSYVGKAGVSVTLVPIGFGVVKG